MTVQVSQLNEDHMAWNRSCEREGHPEDCYVIGTCKIETTPSTKKEEK